MKLPKTIKGTLKMFIDIAEGSCGDNIKKFTEEESIFIGILRADIQNALSEEEFKHILEKYKLEYNG